jgi:predicted PurR-regulated permease PerM
MDPAGPESALPTAPPPPIVAPVAAEPAHLRRQVTVRQYLWVVGAIAVAAAALHFLGPVLIPFVIGAIFAYLGTPIVEWMERRRVPRTLGTVITVLFFGLLIAALMVVLVPLVQAEVGLASKKIPELLGRLVLHVTPWLQANFGYTPAFDLATLREFLAENSDAAKDLSMRLLAGVRSGGMLLLTILINLVLIPVVMFYILRDWSMLWERLYDLVPRRWRAKTRQITGEIDAVLAEFLRGQGMVMVTLATYYVIGLWIAGLQFSLPIGILTGLLVFIPYVGFGLGFTLGMLAAVLQWESVPAFLAILSVYGIGQILENYILLPWLIGDRIGLHPLAVIFSLLAFGALFGLVGVLMALPVSAALLVGLRHMKDAYRASALYDDDPLDDEP